MKISKSLKIYFGLIALLAIFDAVYVFLPFPGVIPNAGPLPAPIWVVALINVAVAIFVYGGLGLFGYWLSLKIGFAQIWDKKVSNRQRFVVPAVIGAGLGIFLIVSDLIFANFNGIGKFPHPPFPTSFVASGAAGIGEEVIFRLFFVSFWVWLISFVILKRRYLNVVFWVVAIFSALVFGAGHFPSVMLIFGWTSFSQVPKVLVGEVLVLNGVVSIFAAYYFRKYGFLAAVGIHFWTDFVWHFLYGSIILSKLI